MNSLYIGVYTDEELYGTLARALRSRPAVIHPQIKPPCQVEFQQITATTLEFTGKKH